MKYGIIGCGNLGKALVRGLLYAGVDAKDIFVNVKSEQTKQRVRAEFEQIAIVESKQELINVAETIILVVEPKNAKEVLLEIGSHDLNGKSIISFMAGIKRAEIRQHLGEQGETTCVVRVMPNVSIANGSGIMGITYDETNKAMLEEVLAVFEKMGYVLQVDEDGLDNITVTAASGLAFAASLMQAYQIAGNELLQNEAASREITLRVFENVIDLIKKEGLSFADLVARIATKGGTTEAGMNALNQEVIVESVEACMQASLAKCKKIV